MGVKENKAILVALFSLALTISFISSIFSPLLYAQKNNRRSRILVDASSNNFPPMNSLDENENLTGFGRELADAVMKAIGTKVTHIHSPHWAEVLKWLDSGQADFIHDTGYTKGRDKFLDYSKPIIEMPEMIFVRPDQYDITGLQSLKGKKVACVNKHISHLYLQTFPEIICYVVKTPVEGLYELISGKVDAFVYPEQIVLYLAQNLRLIDKIKTTGDPLRTLTWSMVVKEGNNEILTLLNKGINKVKETGEYDRIYNKWWGRKALAGYSEGELHIITFIAVGISVAIVSLVYLLFYNYKLRVGQKKLEKEIFERNQVEEALRESDVRLLESNQLLAGVLEHTHILTAFLDPQFNFVWVNRAYADAGKHEPSFFPNKNHFDLYPHEENQAIFQRAVDTGEPFFVTAKPFEYPDDSELNTTYWDWSLIPVKDENGKLTGLVFTLAEVTDRKRAEEQIKASLREKEVLLQEIHHRVKNNMQLIISLLRLQAKNIEDKHYVDMIKESENRINSMALIHEKLYMSKDFSKIDFTEYVRSLVNHLFISNAIDTNKIRLKMDIEDVSFDLESAIPCGLLINEIISNCLKHAFPNDQKGEISIALSSVNENQISLIVRDDGIGISEKIDIKNANSMGLHLIEVLAEGQLRGKLELDRTNGTKYNIKFERQQYKTRI